MPQSIDLYIEIAHLIDKRFWGCKLIVFRLAQRCQSLHNRFGHFPALKLRYGGGLGQNIYGRCLSFCSDVFLDLGWCIYEMLNLWYPPKWQSLYSPPE